MIILFIRISNGTLFIYFFRGGNEDGNSNLTHTRVSDTTKQRAPGRKILRTV